MSSGRSLLINQGTADHTVDRSTGSGEFVVTRCSTGSYFVSVRAPIHKFDVRAFILGTQQQVCPGVIGSRHGRKAFKSTEETRLSNRPTLRRPSFSTIRTGGLCPNLGRNPFRMRICRTTSFRSVTTAYNRMKTKLIVADLDAAPVSWQQLSRRRVRYGRDQSRYHHSVTRGGASEGQATL